MEKKIIRTDTAPTPVGPYSQAIISGGFVFCSGQLAFEPGTGAFIENDVESETSRVMKNLAAVLEAAGSSLSKVVKTTIFLRDMGDFMRVNEVYGSFFDSNPPARSTIQVGALPRGARVEIECIATL